MLQPDDAEQLQTFRPLPTSETNVTLVFDDDFV